MRENIRKIILIIATFLASTAIIFIFVALWRHFGWAIPTFIFLAILSFIGWKIWQLAGAKILLNFIATIITLFSIGFIGWAVWNHFFNKIETSNTSADRSHMNASDSKDKDPANNQAEEKPSSTTENEASNSQSIDSSQDSTNQPTELPKTGFDSRS